MVWPAFVCVPSRLQCFFASSCCVRSAVTLGRGQDRALCARDQHRSLLQKPRDGPSPAGSPIPSLLFRVLWFRVLWFRISYV